MLDRTRLVKGVNLGYRHREPVGLGGTCTKRRKCARSKKRRKMPVTVCIAAIAEHNVVLAASDRMLTAGDIEFQPPRSKILRLTPAIVVMAAAEDTPLHTEIMHRVRRVVYKRIEEDAEDWWMVGDVAELYRYHYDAERVRRAEYSILMPLGLTTDSFVARQDEMQEDFLRKVGDKLLGYELDELEVIICGLDSEGAHIYLIDNGKVSCHDDIAFAAIGAGGRHAASQFMFAGHTRLNSVATTMMLVYSAKKRAEVAPGVGEITDMFSLGPGLGFSTPVAPIHMLKLETEFKAIRKAEERAASKALAKMEVYVGDLLKKIAQQAQEQQQMASPDNEVASSSPNEP
jgi:hypothetical protein